MEINFHSLLPVIGECERVY